MAFTDLDSIGEMFAELGGASESDGVEMAFRLSERKRRSQRLGFNARAPGRPKKLKLVRVVSRDVIRRASNSAVAMLGVIRMRGARACSCSICKPRARKQVARKASPLPTAAPRECKCRNCKAQRAKRAWMAA